MDCECASSIRLSSWGRASTSFTTLYHTSYFVNNPIFYFMLPLDIKHTGLISKEGMEVISTVGIMQKTSGEQLQKATSL